MIKNYLLLFKSLIYDKNLVLISSPFQLISFIEYLNLTKRNKKQFKNSCIFVINSYNQEFNKIKHINKIINYYSNNLFLIDNKILKIIILIILKLRSFFLNKLDTLVIGNYENKFFSRLFIVANQIVFLDDGLNIFNSKKLIFLKIKNSIFFSMIHKKYLKNLEIAKIANNNFLYLKKKIDKNQKLKKKTLFILGGPFVETNILSENQYCKYLTHIKTEYEKFDIFYFPHPREALNNLNNYNFLKVVRSNLPIELYLIKNKILPKIIIGSNSAAFVSIKLIYGNKIHLFNYKLCLNNINLKTNRGFLQDKRKNNLIEKYFSQNNITTSKILV